MTAEDTAADPSPNGSITIRCTTCDISVELPVRFDVTPDESVAYLNIHVASYEPLRGWAGDPLRCPECSVVATTSGGDA